MTDNKAGKSRRKLLKSIAAGSGAIVAGKSLPDSWSRPAVDSVLLPAHAMTSLTESSGPADIQFGGLATGSLFANAADSLVPEAQASVPPIGVTQVCVTQTSATRGNFQAWVVYNDCGTYTVYYTANNVELNVPTVMNTTNLCDVADAGDLFNQMGLIKDAQALPSQYLVTIETFTGPKGGAKGEFDSSTGSGKIPFDLALGRCKLFEPQCPTGIQTLCV